MKKQKHRYQFKNEDGRKKNRKLTNQKKVHVQWVGKYTLNGNVETY